MYKLNERVYQNEKKMVLTIKFEEGSDIYSVDTNFDGMDLEAFIGGVATVLLDYGIGTAECGLSPADIGYLLTSHIMEELIDNEAK